MTDSLSKRGLDDVEGYIFFTPFFSDGVIKKVLEYVVPTCVSCDHFYLEEPVPNCVSRFVCG